MVAPPSFATVCRVCMKYNPKYSIFEHHVKLEIKEDGDIANMQSAIFTKMMDCTGVHILKGDSLPDKICDECLNSLETAYNFKALCEQTDAMLRKILTDCSDSPKEFDIGTALKEEIKNENDSESDGRASVADFINYDCPDADNRILMKIRKSKKRLKNGVKRKKRKHMKFPCENCNERFDSQTLLRKHCKRSHILLTRLIKCYGCGVILKNALKRTEHEGSCSSCGDYACPECGEQCTNREDYEVHTKAHPKHEESLASIFQCETCQKMFKTRANLVQHLYVHRRKREHVCEICGRAFNRRDYLQTHIPTHTGVKKYACPHCDFRSAQKSSLNIHIRTHTGERPYTCDICGQKCINSSNLLAHKRRHEGIKKFKCKLCDKLFAYKASLDEHVSSTHEGLKEHVCHVCGAAYSRKRGLQRHAQQKHSAVRQGTPQPVNGVPLNKIIDDR